MLNFYCFKNITWLHDFEAFRSSCQIKFFVLCFVLKILGQFIPTQSEKLLKTRTVSGFIEICFR